MTLIAVVTNTKTKIKICKIFERRSQLSALTAGKETCEIVGHGAAPEPLFTPENPGEAVRQACGRAR
eukprot:scaffold11387_cov82-Isochrysis_galbana.AAC.3